jgi:transposase-like protein
MPKGKRHNAQFKFQVALDAAKDTKTLSELAGQYELHPSQISEWKSQLLKEGAQRFQYSHCPAAKGTRSAAGRSLRANWATPDGIGVAEKKAAR